MTSPLAELVRRRDPDRFLTALFAPTERREALFALYAFNGDLARAREVASRPTLALIRLQWWREVVEGARRAHEVATPLGAALDEGLLSAADLEAMIEARETEVEPRIETLEAWRAYLLGSAGGVAVAAARLLGAAEPEAARGAGALYGGAGLLRGAHRLALAGRCLLPAELLARHGLSPEHVTADPAASLRPAVLGSLAAEVRSLAPGRIGVGGGAIAAVLPAVLGRRDLRRLGRPPAPRGLADRLAVVLAGVRGRL